MLCARSAASLFPRRERKIGEKTNLFALRYLQKFAATIHGNVKVLRPSDHVRETALQHDRPAGERALCELAQEHASLSKPTIRCVSRVFVLFAFHVKIP